MKWRRMAEGVSVILPFSVAQGCSKGHRKISRLEVILSFLIQAYIRGVLKTFGLLPGAIRGLPFDRKVEALLLDRSDVALIVRPMLVAWRQLREQIATFDKAI